MRLIALLLIGAHFAVSENCPSNFTSIGGKCYYFSNYPTNWYSAFSECKALRSSLVRIRENRQQASLGVYLKEHNNRHRLWIGAKYDWNHGKWLWRGIGKYLGYNAFSQSGTNMKIGVTAHCALIDPEKNNRWSYTDCLADHYYICQKPSSRTAASLTKSMCLQPNLGKKMKRICRKYLGKDVNTNQNDSNDVSDEKSHVQYVCSPDLFLINNKCYHFSNKQDNWSHAFQTCKDAQAQLVQIDDKIDDYYFRNFLNHHVIDESERWLGLIFDWKQKYWIWATGGARLNYSGFADEAVQNKILEWHCAYLDPKLKNRWNTELCIQKKYYVCQKDADKVKKSGVSLKNIKKKVSIDFKNELKRD